MVKTMAATKSITEDVLTGIKEREIKVEDLRKEEMGACPIVSEIADHAVRKVMYLLKYYDFEDIMTIIRGVEVLFNHNQIYTAMTGFAIMFGETGQTDMINELLFLENCQRENEEAYYEFITEFLDNDAIDDLLMADLFEAISDLPEKKHFLPQRRVQ